MSAADVHFEIFVRRYPDSGWTLNAATDVRLTALDSAKEMIDRGQMAAVRVTRGASAGRGAIAGGLPCLRPAQGHLAND